ncbi:magnesium transporter CorA [Erysipelothrix rhusiopathiae]|nr:magnesium transporter CorA [Erysipelothrix rhusiopathiae]
MNLIIYQDAHMLQLPEYIRQSLSDKAELAHIRLLSGNFYIILNYPSSPENIQPICIEQMGTVYNLYCHELISLTEDIQHATLTDLLLHTLKNYEMMVQIINAQLSEYEETMENLVTKANIKALFSLSRKLIRYQTAISAIGDVANYIMKEKPHPLWQSERSSEYTNIRIEVNQLVQNIEMYQQIINSIVDVSESLFSNRLNKIMQTLTSITLVLSVPTFITSFYGMNIDLPFQDHPHALLIVFMISFFLTLGVVVYLHKKDYF